MHIFLGDTPPVLTNDQYLKAATLSAQTWSQPFLACSDLRLSTTPDVDANADVGYDGRNIIAFRKQAWCASSSPTATSATSTCYSHAALAVTTLFKNKNTGEILDADIVFNAVKFSWGDVVTLPNLGDGDTVDFQNALTHEMGHVIGLDHSCYAPADDQPRQLDNTGSPEVDCYANPLLSEAILASTMYPSVTLKDTERRDLAPDDQQGTCDIYPYAHEVCPVATDGGGCATLAGVSSPEHGRSLAAFLTTSAIAGLMLLLYRRRTRRN